MRSSERAGWRLFLWRGPARHPFLSLAVPGRCMQLLWMLTDAGVQQHVTGRIAFEVWALLVRPFAWVATWIDPRLRGWPEWADVGVTSLLGLSPYLLLAAGYRRLLRLRSGTDRKLRAQPESTSEPPAIR